MPTVTTPLCCIQVVRAFKQQNYAPDGGILLSCSEGDLYKGLGIPTAIARKIYPALQVRQLGAPFWRPAACSNLSVGI